MGVSEARKLHIRVKQEEGADAVADRRRDRTVGAAAKAGIGTLPQWSRSSATHWDGL